jgi:hypothetical protein
MRFVFGGNGVRCLPEEVPDYAARNVLDINDALTQVGIVDGPKGAAVLFRDLVERVFDVVTLVFEIPEDLVDQCAVLDNEKMGIKNAGVLAANGVRDTLLDLKKFGASGDKGGLETCDFLGKFLRRNRAKGDFFVVQPMHHHSRMGNAWRDRNSLKTSFLLALGITSTHAARRSRFPSG